MRIVVLIVIASLMHAVRSFDPQAGIGTTSGGTVLAAGFLLLSGYLVGSAFKDMGLPRLTGYLLTGVFFGPDVLDLITSRMLVDLRIFNGIAISLIALTAGTELHFKTIRPLLGTIRAISICAVLGTIALLFGTVFLTTNLLQFTWILDERQLAGVAFLLAVCLTTQSPAVVVALRKETEADGPLVQTVLGVVVCSEVLILLLFALGGALAEFLFGASANLAETVGAIVWAILGSIVSGVLIGVLISMFLRAAKTGGALFILAAGFLIAEVGQRIHFDPLLIALSAGVYICNATPYGQRLHDSIESGSLPVYVAFFTVAGATLHLEALRLLFVPVLIFSAVRACGLLTGAYAGARLTKASATIRRYAGVGLLPQAGLALALALLLGRMFPGFGDQASALIFGVVTVNELIGPVLYRFALARSGEAGKSVSHSTVQAPETPPALDPLAS